MNAQTIAMHFADELSRQRALTQDETDMLMAIVEKRRRDWTDEEVAKLRSMRAARKLAPQIARELGRSVAAVRSMGRQMRRKEIGRG